ncbi:rhamnulokinase [Glaciihabitans sp. INWT7]|uniref:rhamnulokinase n=1 Tax=Glaciihabitans sp. INWT7 TaxID=2596912 RepID=UPI0016256135|nr:rhamnulokinase family protein [Glaciihabitans sp. INWT7]QNE46296.1 rhamnulokinase [Glaciihabitans sp. INWT7]
MTEAVAAVDLGATSGRVMLGFVGHNELSVRPVARFPNLPVRTPDGLHWNILELFRNVTAGLAAAAREEPGLASAGVDSWAVDYGLLRGGRMLGAPFHYRDDRTVAAVETTHSAVSAEQLYAANGLQYLPFNTLYQLEAERDSGMLGFADSLLLIPDLINFWLTGEHFAERTNASTTGLLDITTGEWNETLISRLGLPAGLLAPLVSPGSSIGTLLPSMATEFGIPGSLNIVAVGSHDTASAVVAIPAATPNFAYISCGTWGLVGVELEHPVLSESSRLANFTNEGGVDGRVRYLHNVMGLWLLSESVRSWERGGDTIDLPALLAQASAVTSTVPLFDANDPRFLPPGDMPTRIAEWLSEHGRAAPQSRPEFVRSIVQSLAAAFSDAVRTASELSGIRVDVIHIVGGGSQNELLCQLTATLSGIPVLAGPVEATAIGNVLIQARAQGFVTGSLEALRSLVASAFSPQRFTPAR